MIETIGPHGHTGGRATTARRPASPSPPAPLVGGVLTFGVPRLARLAAPGRRPGRRLRRAAAAIAVAAAIAEIRGVADPAPAAPPAPRALAPGDADAGRRGPLRDPARARLHHLRAHLRRLRAAGISFAVGEPAIGVADRARLRDRPRAADRVRRADRRPRLRRRDHPGDGRAARDLPRRPPRRRARAGRGRRSACGRRAGRRRPHRRSARAPTRRSRARRSSSSAPTASAVLRRGGETSRCPATTRRSATVASP